MSSKNKAIVPTWLILIVLLLVMGVPVAMSVGFLRLPPNPSHALPLLAISGVMALLAILAVVSATFSAIGLSKPEFALGLPEGSVRAVIALGLLVIFVTMTVYLFGEIDGDSYPSTGISREQIDALQDVWAGDIVSIRCQDIRGADDCTVITRIERTEVGKDLAKQTLTTIATLVVAVSSFYFGSRTVAATKTETTTDEPEPFISRVQPNSGSNGANPVIVVGKNFQAPDSVKLVRGAVEIIGTNISFTPTTVSCLFQIDANDDRGMWNLVITNENGKSGQLENAFNIT